MNLIFRTRIGNPVILIDEIEKAGSVSSAKGTYSLTESLLPLLEPATAKAWNCPFYRLGFDMSWISWFMAANNESLLPASFRSRCRKVPLRNLTLAELEAFVIREQKRRSLSNEATAAILGALARAGKLERLPSLCTATRMLHLAEQQDGWGTHQGSDCEKPKRYRLAQ